MRPPPPTQQTQPQPSNPSTTTTTTTTTTPRQPPASCQAIGSLALESPDPNAAEYSVIVDDGVGASEYVEVEASNPVELDEKLRAVEATIGPVTAVTESVPVTALGATPDDDPRYTGPIPNPSQKLALDQVKFNQAWAANEDGSGVVIAVVDTGVQGDHPDLVANLLPGADFVGTQSGTCVDPNGHGTHVAGIAAQVDNTIGGIGGAPHAKLLPVRVLTANGSGDPTVVANGITWAADNGADVINLSLGGTAHSEPIAHAIDYAVNVKGATVVVAAGNCGSKCGTDQNPLPPDSPVYPAADNNNIAVGALVTGDPMNTRAPFSNNNSYIDIAAPGTSIDSTIPTSTYGSKSGTSTATPFVSAVVALILRDCDLTQQAVLAKLQASASQLASDFATTVELADAAAAAVGC